MGDEVKSPEQHTHFIKVVSFIAAHALPFLLCRLRSFDRNAFDGFSRYLEIIAVRSVDGNADRDTLSFSEQAPFCPLFCAVSGIRPSFFPLQGALLSSLPPSNRSSSRCPSIRRIAQGISLASRLENKKDGIHRAPVVHAFPMAPQRMMGEVFWQDWPNLLPEG